MDGVVITYFPTGLGRRLYRSPRMKAALQARTREFDVVHVHAVFLWPTVAACTEADRASRPFVLSPRGMLVPELIRKKSTIVKLAWLALYGRKTVGKACSIHATSEREAECIRRMRLGHQRLDVVPNGLNTDEVIALHHVRGATEPVLVALGRINWEKGLERLIEAMRLLPQARLVIAGNDEEGYRAKLEENCNSAGVADRVTFCGPVYGEAKWQLLAQADLFVAPSLSENFGIAILEAMACGTPVVVTPEVGLAETVRQASAGIVVEGKPQRLADEILTLLDDRSRRQAMSQAALRLVREDFSWTSVAARMDRVYNDAAPSPIA